MNKMKQIIPLLAILLSCCIYGQAQQHAGSITGKVSDTESGKPLPRAVVELLRAGDSIVVKAVITDSAGKFVFINADKNTYLLRSGHASYSHYLSAPFLYDGGQTVMNIGLAIASKTLSGVTVSSRKPVISFLGDKMIINPANLAGASGSNALELMKNMPGITVENEERITLNGSSDVTVLIDDRKRTMTLDQAVRLLKTIPASNVKQVEISVGKSARHDAAGNAGVINIVTKKPLGNGYNLQLTNRVVINDYVGQSHNLYFNYKYNALSFFASAGYDRSNSYSDYHSRSVYRLNTGTSTVSDKGQTLSITRAPYADLGLDYELNKDHVIGITGSLYSGKTGYNNTLQTVFDGPSPRSITNINNQHTPEALNSADLLYTGKLDTLGSKLKVDIGYLSGYARTRPSFTNLYTDENGLPYQPDVTIAAYLPLSGHQYIFQADLEKNFRNRSQLQAGLKHTKGYIDNNVWYDTLKGSIHYRDHRRSDDLSYEEGITAAYLSYRYILSQQLSIVAGVRYENTYMKNISWTIDSSYARSFHDFFPSASITYNGKKIKSTLNFNKSISRPYYGYLNPYTTYVDEFTVQQGNSLLRPGYTYSVSLSNVYDNFLYFSAGYSRASDMLFLLKRQSTDTMLTVIRPENALNYHSVYASLSGFYSLFDEAWEGQLRLYGFVYRNLPDPVFLTSSLDKRTLGRFVLSTSQTVRIRKDLFAEGSFYYYNRNRSNQAEFGSRYQADLGLRKKFFSGALTASVYASDIFNSMGQERLRYYDGYESQSYIRYSTRQLRLSLVFSLGKLNKDFQKNTSAKKEVSRFKESQ